MGQGQRNFLLQWNQTTNLSEFEYLSLAETKKIFSIPLHLMDRLDDELIGTRAVDNQVKSIANRKANRDDHSADSVADSFLRFIIALGFRRRGETQEATLRKLLENIV